MAAPRFVVIGGVAAGMSAASRAKRNMPDMEVTVLEKGSFVSYGACGLPYYVADLVKDVKGLVVYEASFFREKRGIDVRIKHEAVRIDTAKKLVITKDLEKDVEIELPWDTLAICTGAAARIPPLQGRDSANVFVLKTAMDGIAIKDFITRKEPRSAAIIGAGFIGLEAADAFSAHGMEVTVIKRPGSILKMFDEDMVELVENELDNRGVRLIRDADIISIETGDDGMARKVVLADQSVEADMILFATGVKPASDLAREAGLELDEFRAIAVDSSMRTSHPDVYAAGDCVAQKHLITGKNVYVPRGTTANKQGRVAGDNASGGSSVFEGIAGTGICKIFDLTVALTGLSEQQAKKEGFNVLATRISHGSHAHTYPNPEPEPITIKLVTDRKSHRLLGGQMIGKLGVGKRIDILVATIQAGMTVEQLSNLDLSYAPPYAPVWDAVLIAANVAKGKLKK